MIKSVEERINEFCAYHRDGDGECNSVVLRKWADNHNLNFQQRWEIAYLFSITYSVPSAIVLFENKEAWKQAQEIKSKLIFQSDRKYVRMQNHFQNCLNFYMKYLQSPNQFLLKASRGGKLQLETAIQMCEKWYLFGRFSAFLFLEMFIWLTDIEYSNAQTIEWKKGNTATSGLLNVFGYDEEANEFDKSGKLRFNTCEMDKLLNVLVEEIKKSNGDPNVTCIETSLCAYRKHYKGSRYNGYYLDRMLEELNAMKVDFPAIINELFSIRVNNFNTKYLGELNGWNKIRSEKKKCYKMTGQMM